MHYLVTTYISNKSTGIMTTMIETYTEKAAAEYRVHINRFEDDMWDIRSKSEYRP